MKKNKIMFTGCILLVFLICANYYKLENNFFSVKQLSENELFRSLTVTKESTPTEKSDELLEKNKKNENKTKNVVNTINQTKEIKEFTNAPKKIIFSRIQKELSIVPVGMDEKNRMETPADDSQAGWLKTSPIPGNTGQSIIAGHSFWYDEVGDFAYLLDMEIGEQVSIEYEDQQLESFVVIEKKAINIVKEPESTINTADSENRRLVTLITCSGTANLFSGTYDERTLVTLELMG